MITNIDALVNLQMVEGGLGIIGNENLSTCGKIADQLDKVSGTVTIENNAPGCNSTDEIRRAASIPTLSQWGISIMTLCLLILGLVSVRQLRPHTNPNYL